MQRFTTVESIAVPMPRPNIDTDQIIPARFLQKLRKDGFGQYLFHDLAEDPAFILNQPAYRDAHILVAGPNFGCGSSRENAVWALADHGFRVVIAPSFGDIFFNNCLKNGLLPIVLNIQLAENVKVDLESQTVNGHHFAIDPFAKHCLLNGIDELDYTLSLMEEITQFERRADDQFMWSANPTAKHTPPKTEPRP
jgi:3-isopropylmalate/(R)-2-methylmalate dehydratase small subunit